MITDTKAQFRSDLRSLAFFYGGPIHDVAEECEELARDIREREEREARYVKTPLTEPGLYYFDGRGFVPSGEIQ